ncbi:MAG: hypothetical protein ACE5H1_10740 [Thermodesulfobacteriota bacterium]
MKITIQERRTGYRFNQHAAYITSNGIGDATKTNSITVTTQKELPLITE